MERVIGKSKAMEVGLRVLNAYTNYTRPAETDESYLREWTGDTTTPIDELACQVIEAELRKPRAPHGLTLVKR